MKRTCPSSISEGELSCVFLKYEGNHISFSFRVAVAISDSFSKIRFLAP